MQPEGEDTFIEVGTIDIAKKNHRHPIRTDAWRPLHPEWNEEI